MKIAVASGKGGTGKTSFVLSLAFVINKSLTIYDCDVEEPNLHLYLKTKALSEKRITVKKPVINSNICENCELCSTHCKFNAIIKLPDFSLISNELCHSCGVCEFICPKNAILNSEYDIGKMVFYRKYSSLESKDISLISGVLNIGQSMSAPLISNLKKQINVNCNESLSIIDSPPGAACAMFEAVKDTDYIVLVTEATPFGLHDLKMALNTIKHTNIPHSIFINKSDLKYENIISRYCYDNNIKIIGNLQFSRDYAETSSQGKILSEHYPEVYNIFLKTYKNLLSHYCEVSI